MDILEFIKNTHIQTFVEIGAHFGTETEKFREMHPTSRIVCFELDPRNLEMLANRGIDKIAEIHPYALSNVNGIQEFYLSGGNVASVNRSVYQILEDNDWSCSSSLKKPTGHLKLHTWVTFNNKVNVNCIRLDDFEPLKKCNIDFMWVDVQGAEDLVFSGAKDTLKRTKYVYTEYCNSELYESQLNLQGILNLFGPDWVLVHDFGQGVYGGDVLLKNTRL